MDDKKQHRSDCAVHNEPYSPAGPCNCGAEVPERMTGEQFAWMQAVVGVEELAKALHESKRHPDVEKLLGQIRPWNQISIAARASLMTRARYLLSLYDLLPKAPVTTLANVQTPVCTIYGRLGP